MFNQLRESFMSLDTDTAIVTCTVSNSRAVDSKVLFALVDVELEIAGISLTIRGIQARRTPEGTAVIMPTFKDADGSQRPAVILPTEMKQPLFRAILDHLLDTGLAKRKYTP
jgi:stage V sporulation protein G